MSQLEIINLTDGVIHIDGGAMFGVVPKTMWERAIAPDELNRLPLGLHCLLLRGDDCNVLVDTGVGCRRDDRFASIYGLENTGKLLPALASLGLAPEDITHVINTHLHFDHCGGNTVTDPSGDLVPAFPSARYIVQRGEWEDANAPGERSRASYLADDFRPIADAGLLDLVEGESLILPGLEVIPAPGHTLHHQVVLATTSLGRLLHAGDLIPTSSHLPLPWITGYDLYPVMTLETKRDLLGRQREEDWLLYCQHEPGMPLGKVEWSDTEKGERPMFRPLSLP